MTAREIIDLSSLVEKGLMSHAKYNEILKARLNIDAFDNPTNSLSGKMREKTALDIQMDEEAKLLQQSLIAKTELDIKLKENQLKISDGILKKLEEL